MYGGVRGCFDTVEWTTTNSSNEHEACACTAEKKRERERERGDDTAVGKM